MGSHPTVERFDAHNSAPSLHEIIPSGPRKHRWWVWILVILVAAGAVWYFHGVAQNKQAQAASSARARQANQTVPVVVAAVTKGDLPIYYTGLGTVTAYNTVTVHTRVDGQIMKVYFREGQFVHKGDALVEIDPRPYQVQLEQAQGQLAKDTAALHDATLDFNRYSALYAAGVIPKQQLDTQTSTMDQEKGAIVSDQAAIDNAKLQLAYSHVTAPIDGRIGLRLVDPGNIVHATDANGLIVITQLQPISVIFTLPQDQLPDVYKQLRLQRELPVDAYDRDDTTKIASGTLLTMDNQIDTTTGTYKLKAVFNNRDNALFPNQFVNIHLLVNTLRGVTMVPAAAVQRGPEGTYVYVASPENTVKVRSVAVGLTMGDFVTVSSGLEPGEQVVTDGIDKLADGSRIELRNPIGGAGTNVGAPAQSASTPATQSQKPQSQSGNHGKRRGAPGK